MNWSKTLRYSCRCRWLLKKKMSSVVSSRSYKCVQSDGTCAGVSGLCSGARIVFCFFFFVLVFFAPQCHHTSFVDFMVLPPGHGRSVIDFWGWDAHEAQLRCPDGVWVVIEGDVVPGGALNLNSTNLPRPRSPWESSPSRKNPTVEPGIEPGTSWLVVRDSDHQTTRLVQYIEYFDTQNTHTHTYIYIEWPINRCYQMQYCNKINDG